MRKLLTATALIATLISGSAFAKDDKPDYLNNKEDYICENEQLEDHLKKLYANDDKIEVIYVKGATEVSRTEDGLKCKATVVFTRAKVDGVIVYKYEDGHALYGFKPGRVR